MYELLIEDLYVPIYTATFEDAIIFLDFINARHIADIVEVDSEKMVYCHGTSYVN